MSAFQQLNKYGEKFTDDIKKAKEDALDMLIVTASVSSSSGLEEK